MTTDPTERLAEALEEAQTEVWVKFARRSKDALPAIAVALIAQGFGHRDDILRAFADYAEKSRAGDRVIYIRSLTDSYLASLAAKGDTSD